MNYFMRPTVLEINFAALRNNLKLVQKRTQNKQIIAVVKADAYGLGSVEVARVLKKEAVSFFAVALLEEAIELRDNDITDRILLLCPLRKEEIPDLVLHNITPTIMDLLTAQALNVHCQKKNIIYPIHLKVDTGMGRLGIKYDQAYELIEQINELSNIKIDGLFSHFPSADIPDIEFTRQQISSFSELIQKSKAIIKDSEHLICHQANSGGIINFPSSHFTAVRPGIMLYGCYPAPYTEFQIQLNKVATLKTEILTIKKMKPGESVSYGRTFIASHDTRVAVLPIGYADGYPTLLSSKGEVMINSKKAPVIGRVCMDYTMVDVSAINGVEIGDEAVLIGNGITEEDIANKTHLIPYEILTGISKRVPRKYIP